jgi:hypothetical protein
MVRDHQPGEAVFKSILLEDIDWKPFPAFPPSADWPWLLRSPLTSRCVTRIHRNCSDAQSGLMRMAAHGQCFHFIEQPIEGICSCGPRPVSATCFIASNRSRRAFATAVMREASSRPRYCNSSCALKPKKSGVH